MTGEFAIAVHALVFLNHKQATQNSEQLAENVCTNPARIRKVMGKLKKAGLVATKEGAEGGYHFELDPAAVNLATVLHAVEGHAVDAPWRSGSMDMECLIASGMAGIMEDICSLLNEDCLKRLAAITVADIDRRIFG